MKYKVISPYLAAVLKNNGYDEKEISRRCYMAFHDHEWGGKARFFLGCGSVLILTKESVNEIPTYTPGEWNEYPAVKPPMADCRYLVTLEGIIGATWVDIAKWSGEWWEVNQGARVLAFREKPKPYLLNEIEDIDGLKKEGEDD